MSKPSIHVAIAIIFHQSKVLVGWRNIDQHQGSKYEFPGGKVEQGESPEMACHREVLEETGLDISTWHRFDCIQHDYDDIQVNLHLFHTYLSAMDFSIIQAPWAWYSRPQLQHLNFPAANVGIIERLVWPHVLKISEYLDQLQSLPENILMYWRVGHDETYLAQLLQLTPIQLSQLIINIDLWRLLPEQQQKQISAVHFKQHQLLLLEKGQLPLGIRCIAACHDTVSVEHAHQVGFDAVLLSPVLTTATHLGADVLGWDQFKDIAKCAEIPIFALGGLKPQDLIHAKQYHAYGVAGIRNF